MRDGAQEQAVLEARRDVPDHIGDLGVDRVAARAGGGSDVGLVEDEQALGRALADVLEQRIAILGAAEDRVRDDEPRVRAPRVHAEAALLTTAADERPVHDLEVEAEAVLHLVAPLQGHRCRADHQHELDSLPEQQLLGDQAGLDGPTPRWPLASPAPRPKT